MLYNLFLLFLKSQSNTESLSNKSKYGDLAQTGRVKLQLAVTPRTGSAHSKKI